MPTTRTTTRRPAPRRLALAGRLLVVGLFAAGAGCAQGGHVTYSSPQGVHAPAGHYSHAAVVNGAHRILYLAGQVGIRPDGGIDANDVVAQAIQALRNVDAILRANGASWEHVVKWTWYVVAPLQEGPRLDAFRRVRAELMSSRKAPMPASTLVYVKALAGPEYLIELEITAVVPQ